jgi:hypothetical protein
LSVTENGKVYHEPSFPPTVKIALNDPKFYKLDEYEKRNVMGKIDNEFEQLSEKDKTFVIADITTKGPARLQDLKSNGATTTNVPKYNYTSYFTWNIGNCIVAALLSLVAIFVLMECFRRVFYYVVLGKLSPD